MGSGKFSLNIGEFALVAFGVTLVLVIILLLVLLIHKKDETKLPKGKKGLIVFLTIMSVVGFAVTALVFTNIIPLSLPVGYYIEEYDFNHDGKTGGLKITMDRGFDYTSSYDGNSEFHEEKEGQYRVVGSYLKLEFNKGEKYEFDLKNFGKELYMDGNLCYRFVKYIEVRR